MNIRRTMAMIGIRYLCVNEASPSPQMRQLSCSATQTHFSTPIGRSNKEFVTKRQADKFQPVSQKHQINTDVSTERLPLLPKS